MEKVGGDGQRAAVLSSSHARQIPWHPSPAAAGVYVKDLAAAGGCLMQLVRYEAGAKLAIAPACSPVFLHVLGGELIHCGRRLWPGSTEVVGAGAEAGDSYTDVGCTFLLVSWNDPGRTRAQSNSHATGRSGSGT